MKVLIAFFLKYLLAPLLVTLMVLCLTNVNVLKKKFSVKKLIIFILVSAVIITIPALFGFLKNEYVWGGLILTTLSYLIMGTLYLVIADTKLYSSMGFGESGGFKLVILAMCSILGGWCYYLLFEWISDLPYSLWCLASVVWIFVPLLVQCSLKSYLAIPHPIYNPWELSNGTFDRTTWDKVDSFKTQSVRVQIKRRILDKSYASLNVKFPHDISVGNWFNWFIEDQNRRFPQETIETDYENIQMGWIFYTPRWLNIPIFVRVLDPDKTRRENKLKNNQTVYVHRIQLTDK